MTTSQANRPNPVNHAMLMGLELGIWFAINFIVSAQEMKHPSLGVLSWLVTFYVVYGVYRAAQHYKRFECGDTITFGAAYSYIIWLFLCASLVAALIRFAYLQWVDPAFLPSVEEMIMSMLKADPEALKVDPEEMKAAMQTLLTPIRFSVYYSMWNMLQGALIALIMAPVVVRRKARFIYPFGRRPGDKDSADNDQDSDRTNHSEN